MVPGDLFEWVYKSNGEVIIDDILWSSVTERFIPLGGRATLISTTDEVFTWLSEKGLFSMRSEDLSSSAYATLAGEFVMRKCVL